MGKHRPRACTGPMNRGMSRASALAAIGAGTGAFFFPANIGAQAPVKLRIGTSTSDAYAEPFFATDMGFFARAGIDADITIMNYGAQLATAIAAGALDVAVADPIQVAHPVDAGVPLAFFAGSGLYTSSAPTTVVVVAKDSPYKTARDLEGKSVAVPGLGSITALAASEWIRQSGAALERISLVELPYSAVRASLVRGTIGASVLSEPFLTDGKDDLRVLGKCHDAIGLSFYINSWFAPKAWLAKNPDLARRLTAAIYETARWANTHHLESAPICAKYLKLDIATVRAMTRVTFGTTLDPKLLQPVLDVAYRFHQLERVNAATLIHGAG